MINYCNMDQLDHSVKKKILKNHIPNLYGICKSSLKNKYFVEEK